MVDYDQHYQRCRTACGEPFQEVVDFFAALGDSPVRVLDLGCGQGRDALLAARQGHDVVGVDVSPVGITQMLESAAAESLAVEGVVGDIRRFRSRRRFGVVILDRVLHMLSTDADRLVVLGQLKALTRVGGFVLIADTPKHRALIRRFFEAHGVWHVVPRKGDHLCLRKRRSPRGSRDACAHPADVGNRVSRTSSMQGAGIPQRKGG